MIDIDKLANLGGHIYDERLTKDIIAKQPIPMMSMARDIKNTHEGKEILLSDYVMKVAPYPLREQTVGDCTGQGNAYAIDCLKGVGCVLRGEEFIAETCPEVAYSFGRVECSNRRFSGNDGCSGAAVADGAKRFGSIARGVYGKYDLRKYDGNLSRKWGESGVPDDLEITTKQHCCKSISLVSTFNELADSIINGYPVTVASNQGFSGKRDRYGKILKDQDGFLYPNDTWFHQMCIIGVSCNRRKAALIQNSWGDWLSGPTIGTMPPGSFWVDAEVVERMLLQGDSFSYSNLDGYPPQKLNLRIL